MEKLRNKLKGFIMSLSKLLFNLSVLCVIDLHELTAKNYRKTDNKVKPNVFGDELNSPECPTCGALVETPFYCQHCGDITPHEAKKE